VCATAFFVVQTALQAMSRAVYAFSRDHGTVLVILDKLFTQLISEGLPDGGYFGKNSEITHTPLRAIWFSTIVSVLPGLLDLASPIAANAIFSVTAMALDLSYIIPIFCRRVYYRHPDVMFKPGPFYMGDGWLGFLCNCTCITWTLFVCVIFSIPTNLPVTKLNMNYASVSSCLQTISLIFMSFFKVIAIGVIVFA
jgi:Amino acid permease